MPDQVHTHRQLSFSRLLGLLACLTLAAHWTATPTLGSSLRRTAIVEAVEEARPSVVNIHGRKTVRNEYDEVTTPGGLRQVNGMGTGVVIDERGYIITNYHVVEGVGRIQVTTSDGATLIAHLVSHDPKTDLAIIKVDRDRPLPVITIGTSEDLMTGETVIAIGNAYGYEHTVTKGIISALHRPVQVSEDQKYVDLIQTDASINPGNSGGPLLNIDGEMVGLNVAVRVGAQGIGFAVPIDQALEVAARLIDIQVTRTVSHGIRGKSVDLLGDSKFVVTSITQGGPAESSGLVPGDVVTTVDDSPISRSLEFHSALLDHNAGDELELEIVRNGEPRRLRLVLDEPQRFAPTLGDRVWQVLGMRLGAISERSFDKINTRFRGGLRVIAVRPESPAASQGIRYGDILVGMLKWETVTLDNVSYILESDDFRQSNDVKFYILRGNETLFGNMRVSL